MKIKTFIMMSFVLMLVSAACSPSPANVTVENAWARPASMTMGMSGDTDDGMMMDMNQETDGETDMSEESGEMMMEAEDESSTTDGVSAIYLTLKNSGGQADRLIRVETEAAAISEIHQTTVEDDGMMRMRPVEFVEIPPGGSAALAPGGYHVMLMQLAHDLEVGKTISVTLTFASGKEITLDVPVQDNPPA